MALAAFLAVPATASAVNALGIHGSVNQVYVTGAQPGTQLRLLDRRGHRAGRQGLSGPRRGRFALGPGGGDEEPDRPAGSLDL
jgi:hypothetical protein